MVCTSDDFLGGAFNNSQCELRDLLSALDIAVVEIPDASPIIVGEAEWLIKGSDLALGIEQLKRLSPKDISHVLPLEGIVADLDRYGQAWDYTNEEVIAIFEFWLQFQDLETGLIKLAWN